MDPASDFIQTFGLIIVSENLTFQEIDDSLSKIDEVIANMLVTVCFL